MADETRKDQRVKAPVLRAKYKSRTVDEFVEKYSRDISRSGMWIKTGKPPALGTLLKVEIQLEDGSPVISAVGRVVKRREEAESSTDNPAGMGIRFLKVEESSQPVIDRIVALKGEDAGPHFENIRTGVTVPPPPPGEIQSGFFGSTNPSQQMPPESERTMMRQMNALLGEALRQVNETSPRKPGDATSLPTQKATIMGVAAPSSMLQAAIASGKDQASAEHLIAPKGPAAKAPTEEEGPTRVAARSEVDSALATLKSLDEEPAKRESKEPAIPPPPATRPISEPDERPAGSRTSDKPAVAEPRSEAKPAVATPKPAVAEAKPVVAEAKPAVAEAKPAVAEAKPAVAQAKPAVAEAKPVIAETKPAVVEAKPVVAETKPAVVEARPVVAEAKPTLVEAKPETKTEEPLIPPVTAPAAKADEKVAEAVAKTEEKAADAVARVEDKAAEVAKKADDKAEALVVKVEKKTDEKFDEKRIATKVEAKDDKKPVVAPKAEDKKPAAAPVEEPGGMNMVAIVGAIAVALFLLYWFVFRGG